MEQKVFAFFVAILLLIGLSSRAICQERQTIKIVTIGFSPYGIQTEQGNSGIYYDIANILVQKSGYHAENTIAPYARIINDLKYGQADISILFRYEELEAYVFYIAPLAPLQTVVLSRQDSHLKNIESLHGRRLAYLRGAHFSEVIDKNNAIKLHKVTDFKQAVKMLLNHRVDAIVGPMDPIISAAAEIGYGMEIFGHPIVVGERTPWIQLSKKSTANINIKSLQETFIKMKKEDVILLLRKQYLPERLKIK
ncbi:MAG: transporter substrate-binding domain-containing protein [Pseudomonadales bacterium]|nr:transporter substrate-binding domain-containing protein [Pseudomonadales bacterium]